MSIKKFGWIILVGASLMTGCGKSMPKEVIPPAKMEKVLYDYHLTRGISSQLSGSEEFEKQAYKNYLFKKHQITEAQFDSSMLLDSDLSDTMQIHGEDDGFDMDDTDDTDLDDESFDDVMEDGFDDDFVDNGDDY